jgi:hypothetical protein
MLNSTLIKPKEDDELDYKSLVNNTFKVLKTTDTTEDIKEGDTIIIDKNFLNYVDF